MANMEQKSFDSPDEVRTPPKAKVEVVKIGESVVSRITYYPGFRWTTDIKPVVGTDLCQVNHFGYVLSGHAVIRMADGTETTLDPGNVGTIPAGHDAWVVGDEPFVSLDFSGVKLVQ